MKIKIAVFSLFFGYSLLNALPVVSAPQVVENVMTELRNTYETLVTWKREAEEWKNDYEAITKFKLDGNLLQEFTKINNILGKHGLSMGDIDLDNPSSEIEKMAKQMFDAYSIFDDCKYEFMTDGQKRRCRDTIVREVQEIQTILQFSEQISKALEKLNDLNAMLRSGSKSSKKTSEAGSDGGFDMETYSQNLQEAKAKADEQKDTSLMEDFVGLFVDESDGSVSFDDFSIKERIRFDDMMKNFSDAENQEVESDENSMKMSQDITAGIKSLNTTVKALRIQYRLMQIKNRAKEALDKRRAKQEMMKKFEYEREYIKERAQKSRENKAKNASIPFDDRI